MSGLTTAILSLAIIATAATAACGPKLGPMPAMAEPVTRAELAGPLCSGELCKCREEVGGKFAAGEPDQGLKRYEVRVGPTGNDLRVTVGSQQIYKSAERPTECFYVDLAPGKHPVTIRAHGEPSFGAALQISEMGYGPNPEWYRSFFFECGTNVCAIENLKDWRDDAAQLGEKQDPCGSTKVSSVNYQHGSVPDGLHPIDLFVTATLQVYAFRPTKPSCPGGSN